MVRPILFNDEMAQALLEGRKTQTRRIVKGTDHDLLDMMCEDLDTGEPNSEFLDLLYGPSTDDDGNHVPDQWLVRCAECPEEGVLTMGQGYGQIGDSLEVEGTGIKLEITNVRVELLQYISEDDAKAEGAKSADPVTGRECVLDPAMGSYRLHFQSIWQSIYGPDSWDANPWVWVIEFRRVD